MLQPIKDCGGSIDRQRSVGVIHRVSTIESTALKKRGTQFWAFGWLVADIFISSA